MVHEGHRERLRNRFIAAPDSFEDHELLELLLFYAIPRKNTNETAHILLERFGSIKGIIDAGLPALKSIDAIGDSSAVFFRAIAEALIRYERCECQNISPVESYASSSKFLKSLFVGTENEITYIILLDSSKNLITCEKIAEGYSCGNVMSMRELTTLALNNNAACAILAHNHPGGKAIPSGEDIYATNVIKTTLNTLGITLLEHFIVAENECVPIINKDKTRIYNC